MNALTLDTLEQLVDTARMLRRDRSCAPWSSTGRARRSAPGSTSAPCSSSRCGWPPPSCPGRGTAPTSSRRRAGPGAGCRCRSSPPSTGTASAAASRSRWPPTSASPTPTPRGRCSRASGGSSPTCPAYAASSELVGIETAKRLTMTAEMFSGKEALELGLVSSVDAYPAAAALELAEQLKQRSPDQLAAAKRLFNDTWTSSAAAHLRPRAHRAGLPALQPQHQGRPRGRLHQGRPGLRAPLALTSALLRRAGDAGRRAAARPTSGRRSACTSTAPASASSAGRCVVRIPCTTAYPGAQRGQDAGGGVLDRQRGAGVRRRAARRRAGSRPGRACRPSRPRRSRPTVDQVEQAQAVTDRLLHPGGSGRGHDGDPDPGGDGRPDELGRARHGGRCDVVAAPGQ